MKTLSALLVMIVVCFWARPIHAQAPLPFYTDHLVNGFQDWSWGTRDFANTSPVHTGANSISASLNTWEAISFWHPQFDTTVYDSFSFWANGGAAGGQVLQVYPEFQTGSGLVQGPAFSLSPLPANAWQQFTIPLASLGAANVSNYARINIQLTGAGTTGTFYLDDVQFNAAPAPAIVHLTLNATQTIRAVDARCFGINTAIWDSYFDTPQTISLLRQMGAKFLRCMGGSTSDEYHWAYNKSLNNTWTWATSFANLLHVATNIGAQVITTVNYGTGSTNEAAAWVAYANGFSTNSTSLGTDQYGTNWQTVGYWASLRAASPLQNDDGKNFLRIGRTAPLGFKYWEVGNECHGTWETDSNNLPHDPFTYANRAGDYIQLMKKVDSTIKIGLVATPGEESYSNNATHNAFNPRTGQTHYGWTPILLATIKNLGVTPDFLIHHSYAPGDCDPFLLQFAGGPGGWAADASSLRQMLSDYFGVNGTNVELCVTENNSFSSGKQLTSLVDGIYLADSLCQLLKTEFNSFLWWDLRNGTWTTGSVDPTVYGWRLYGDEGVIGGLNTCFPTFYGFELMQHFAQAPDTIVNAASDYSLLSAYAARRTNGTVSLLVLNKDTVASFNARISISDFAPDSRAVSRSYGIPQDEAARTNGPAASQDLATNFLSGVTSNFSHTFPPLSLTLLTFSPAAPTLAVLPQSSRPSGTFVFELRGQAGIRYVLQNSSNLVTWARVATNVLATNTLNVTNNVTATAHPQFWRAVWEP